MYNKRKHAISTNSTRSLFFTVLREKFILMVLSKMLDIINANGSTHRYESTSLSTKQHSADGG